MRTADWFGEVGLLFSRGSVDPWNPKAVRASMGGILRVPVAIDCPFELLTSASSSNADRRPIIGMDSGGDPIVGGEQLPLDGIYLIGSEADGLGAEVRSHCDRFVSVPPGGLVDENRPTTDGSRHVESLNAGVAAALLLWELARSRIN